MVIEKETVIRNIVEELKEIPLAYLENLYAIVHTFRINLPAKEEQEEDFDWDSLVEEVNENRKNNNLSLATKLDNLFAE